MRLTCPGVFSVRIPRDWAVTGQPDECVYQLHPPGSDAEVYINVAARDGSQLGHQEAQRLLGEFLTRAVGGAAGRIRTGSLGQAQQRAVAHFTYSRNDHLLEWIISCTLWPHASLMCSYNAITDGTGSDGSAEVAARIFAAIRPAGVTGRLRISLAWLAGQAGLPPKRSSA